MTRTILVTGASGQQGRALISSLFSSTSPSDTPFRVLAMTRNPSGPAAQSLLTLKPGGNAHLELVKGDLDDTESVRKVFQTTEGGVWGVFAVLAFPGLGANADGEERQGITLADLAFEFGVSHYVYSSAERGGEAFDEEWTLSRAAKAKIERHVKGLGEKGLKWTILRPVFFMENFQEGTIGNITVGILRAGLQTTTKVQLIAAEDIGHVAAAVFQNPEKNIRKIIVVVGDVLTTNEQDEAYKRATGKSRPSTPWFLAKTLLTLNAHTRELISELERLHRDRSAMDRGYEGVLQDVREVYPGMMTFEQWAKKRAEVKAELPPGWNKVSLLGLITGKQ